MSQPSPSLPSLPMESVGQADRTHHIGQLRKDIAYRLLIKDSIEEKIRALQRQKK